MGKIHNYPEAEELWRGFGGYFDSFPVAICELIDNSISNLTANNCHNKKIVIRFQYKNKKVKVSIEDNGTGIKDLHKALTLGNRDCAESPLNEHGYGFKHALAYVEPTNRNWSIYTCTEEDKFNSQYKRVDAPYLIDNMEDTIIKSSWPSPIGTTGTKIEFECSMETINTINNEPREIDSDIEPLLNNLKEELGCIYSTIIEKESLRITIVHEDDLGELISEEEVKPVVPEWDGVPNTEFETVNLGRDDVLIEYAVGHIKESVNNTKYYKKNMASSGVEIRINGRLIANSLITEIWKKEKHPNYNSFLAIVNVISDNSNRLPRTKTTKSGLNNSDICVGKLYKWIREKYPQIPKKSKVGASKKGSKEKITENELFEELVEVKKSQFKGNYTIETQVYAFVSFDERVRMDLYVRDDAGEVTIYEGKKDKTTPLDIFQLIMYWFGCVYDGKQPSKGILISACHPKSVEVIAKIINKRLDPNGQKIKIVLKTWKEEGVQYPR